MPKKSPASKKPSKKAAPRKPRTPAAKARAVAKRVRNLGIPGRDAPALQKFRDEWRALHEVLDKAGIATGGTVLDRVRRLSEREMQSFNKLIDARAQIGSLKAAHTIGIESAVAALQRIVAAFANADDPEHDDYMGGVDERAALASIEADVKLALKSLAPPVEPVFDAVTPIHEPLPEGGFETIVPASTLPPSPSPPSRDPAPNLAEPDPS